MRSREIYEKSTARTWSKTIPWFGLTAATAALLGCSDPAADAENRYQMVERNGTKGELCRAAQVVAEVYLQAKNEERYGYWRNIASMRCQLAQFDGPNSMAQDSDASRQAEAEASAAAAEAMSIAAETAKGAANAD